MSFDAYALATQKEHAKHALLTMFDNTAELLLAELKRLRGKPILSDETTENVLNKVMGACIHMHCICFAVQVLDMVAAQQEIENYNDFTPGTN